MTFVTPETTNRRLQPLARAPEGSLLVHEIYASIQGESTYAGLPCTFVRTTGCHLRCFWCDTPHAFAEGRPLRLDEVIFEVERLGLSLVEITGGEPLLQPTVLPLMTRLCDAGYRVLLETSGALDIGPVDRRVARIVDMKTPSSGEQGQNRLGNLELLEAKDELKLVIADRADYEWSRALVREQRPHERCSVLFGPVWGTVPGCELARWIIEDRLPVRMQLQLHKHIWDPAARGV